MQLAPEVCQCLDDCFDARQATLSLSTRRMGVTIDLSSIDPIVLAGSRGVYLGSVAHGPTPTGNKLTNLLQMAKVAPSFNS